MSDAATCPWCGNRVPTFPTLNDVLVFEGHRSRTRSLTSVGLAWCEGGGRKVPDHEPERWPCGCVKGETYHGAGWLDCEFATHKGSNKNPLTSADLPFTVPVAGRYWIQWGTNRHLLPEAPEGSVLDLDLSPTTETD